MSGDKSMTHDYNGPPVTWSRVEAECSQCGQRLQLAWALRIENGPTKAGSLADLFGDAELPASLARTLTDTLPWCSECGEWAEPTQDRRRVWISPRERLGWGA